MSEQINEQVETNDATIDVDVPEVEAEVQVAPQPQVIVMPTVTSVKQRMLDTGLTMVCGVVVTSAFNVVTNAAGKAIAAGGRKLKSFAEAKKEKKLQKKAAKEAAKLEAAKSQEKTEEPSPDVNEKN